MNLIKIFCRNSQSPLRWRLRKQSKCFIVIGLLPPSVSLISHSSDSQLLERRQKKSLALRRPSHPQTRSASGCAFTAQNKSHVQK
uniref:Uncharacterized protein n=1 Tax=Denticeps clupeoides TaxID=299321 RepID=A0AAY4AF15_9TELE